MTTLHSLSVSLASSSLDKSTSTSTLRLLYLIAGPLLGFLQHGLSHLGLHSQASLGPLLAFGPRHVVKASPTTLSVTPPSELLFINVFLVLLTVLAGCLTVLVPLRRSDRLRKANPSAPTPPPKNLPPSLGGNDLIKQEDNNNPRSADNEDPGDDDPEDPPPLPTAGAVDDLPFTSLAFHWLLVLVFLGLAWARLYYTAVMRLSLTVPRRIVRLAPAMADTVITLRTSGGATSFESFCRRLLAHYSEMVAVVLALAASSHFGVDMALGVLYASVGAEMFFSFLWKRVSRRHRNSRHIRTEDDEVCDALLDTMSLSVTSQQPAMPKALPADADSLSPSRREGVVSMPLTPLGIIAPVFVPHSSAVPTSLRSPVSSSSTHSHPVYNCYPITPSPRRAHQSFHEQGKDLMTPPDPETPFIPRQDTDLTRFWAPPPVGATAAALMGAPRHYESLFAPALRKQAGGSIAPPTMWDA